MPEVRGWNPVDDPVISALRRRFARAGTVGIALDVDDVKADTSRPRFVTMAQKYGLPPGKTVDDLMSEYEYIEDVPLWQTPAALADAATMRVSVPLHLALAPLPGAVAGVAGLNAVVPVVVDITSRIGPMRASTAEWNRRNGFPDVPVITGPAPIDPAALSTVGDWKVAVLEYLWPYVIGIVDDNPKLLNALPWDYPGHVYVFGDRAATRPPVHPRAHVTPDWAAVQSAVRADLAAQPPAMTAQARRGQALG